MLLGPRQQNRPNSDMKRSAPHGASSAAIERKDSCLARVVKRRTMLAIRRISSLSPWSRSSVRSRLNPRWRAAMQRIGDWLRKLGMSEYARRFTENDIDISVLHHLTDQDLKELGVSLGHRRKMLAAIAELASAVSGSPKAALTEPKPQDTAERRQVTVMFSDLVGSTALSAHMDPEDLRELSVAEIVCRFGGFVARYMGDGVLVYFGYPQAHEDDAERVVRAGLELIAAVVALASPVSLQTRVGIATGLVVVGDLVGSGEAQE